MRFLNSRRFSQPTMGCSMKSGTTCSTHFLPLSPELRVEPSQAGNAQHDYVDLSFLFTIDQGKQWNEHLNSEYLAVLETDHSTPY